MKTKLLLFAFSGALMTGCVRAPVVELTQVRLGGIGLRSATLVAVLRIENPNRFAIEADSVLFELQANGSAGEPWSDVTTQTHEERNRFEGKSVTTIELPIALPYAGLRTPIRSLLEQGTFNYRLSGAVFVRKPLPRRVPFSEQGNLSVMARR